MRDLNEMGHFVEVARSLSFTAAAKRLGVPKSTISRSLTSLERRLGVRLLERTTRRVALTEVGETYLRHCQRLVDEAEEADAAISSLGDEPRGVLRVAANVTFARSVLGPAIGEFLNRYPDLRLSMLLEGNVDPIQANVDVAIHVGAVVDSGLVVRKLAVGHLGLYASPGYLARHGAPAAPSNLTEHACTTMAENGEGSAWDLHRQGEAVRVRLKPRLIVRDPVLHLHAALSGATIAALPGFLVGDAIEAGHLIRVLPEWEPKPMEIFALYGSRLGMTPKLRAFLDFAAEQLRPFTEDSDAAHAAGRRKVSLV